MSLRSSRRYFALGLLVVLGAAGCGVDGDLAPPPAEPLVISSEAPTAEPIVIESEAPRSTESEPSASAITAPESSTAPPAIEPQAQDSEAGQTGQAAEAERSAVLAQLETVAVKGRAPRTDYDRDHFGRGWKDPDRNGCDARNDILRRDLVGAVSKPGTQGCVILTGVLEDPFTGQTIEFVRGQDTSAEVQIDHVVALSDAWQKGAQQMTPEERVEFANDPLNLLAVDGPTNASKSDGDAATWLPPHRGFRCDYVARQTAVKAKYDLWMTVAERDAVRGIVTTQCPA